MREVYNLHVLELLSFSSVKNKSVFEVLIFVSVVFSYNELKFHSRLQLSAMYPYGLGE